MQNFHLDLLFCVRSVVYELGEHGLLMPQTCVFPQLWAFPFGVKDTVYANNTDSIYSKQRLCLSLKVLGHKPTAEMSTSVVVEERFEMKKEMKFLPHVVWDVAYSSSLNQV